MVRPDGARADVAGAGPCLRPDLSTRRQADPAFERNPGPIGHRFAGARDARRSVGDPHLNHQRRRVDLDGAAGGRHPTKLADGLSASVSPVGMSLAFTDHRGELRVCTLPACNRPQTLGSVPVETPIAWAPGGRRVAYGAEGNVWCARLAAVPPSADPIHRRSSHRLLCVVTRWQTAGHLALDGGQRHRLAARGEQVSSRALDDCRTIGAAASQTIAFWGKERTTPCGWEQAVHSRTPISLRFLVGLPSVRARGRWRERGRMGRTPF